jgi:hypothetical protein
MQAIKMQEKTTLTDLLNEALFVARNVIKGTIAPAQAMAAARSHANVARFLELRCDHGDIEI